MTDLGSTDLADNAEQPLRATIDGNTVEQHSLANQQAIADRKKSDAAMTGQKRGMFLTQMKHSGSQ